MAIISYTIITYTLFSYIFISYSISSYRWQQAEQIQLQWDLIPWVFTASFFQLFTTVYHKTFPSSLVLRPLGIPQSLPGALPREWEAGNTQFLAFCCSRTIGMKLQQGHCAGFSLTKARAGPVLGVPGAPGGSWSWLDGASLFCKRNFICWDSLYIFIRNLLKKKKRKITVQWQKKKKKAPGFISSLWGISFHSLSRFPTEVNKFPAAVTGTEVSPGCFLVQVSCSRRR